MKGRWIAEPYEYETHYFFDARMAIPSIVRSHSKTEEGARKACIVRIDAEQYNKAVILHSPTQKVLQIYRRDRKTGNIERKDHRWTEWAEEPALRDVGEPA
jgi:hypothetical protein